MRITRADHFPFGHDQQRIGTLQLTNGGDQCVFTVLSRLRKPMQYDLAVDGGLKNRTAFLQLLAQYCGIGEVTVMSNGDLAAGTIHRQRLGIANVRTAGG